MAIFDLAGKASRQPALVAARRRRGRAGAPATRPWSPARPAEVADDAERWAARGFTTFKLKLGTADDVAQVRAVRERLGAERESGSTPTAPGASTRRSACCG